MGDKLDCPQARMAFTSVITPQKQAANSIRLRHRHNSCSGSINDQRVNERYKMRRFLLFAIFIQLHLSANLAQSKMDAFSGSWLRDEVIQKNGRPLPRVTWKIAFDEKAMTLTERGEDGTVTRTVRYNLDGTETQTKPDRLHKVRWDAERQVIQLSETMVGNSFIRQIEQHVISMFKQRNACRILPHKRDKTLCNKREFPGGYPHLFHNLPGVVAPISRRQIRIDSLETMLIGKLVEYSNKEGK